MSILGLVIFLIVACVIIWSAQKILAAFGIGDPIATVIYVLLVLLMLFAILGQFGFGPDVGLRLR
jgi:hypothetical protein